MLMKRATLTPADEAYLKRKFTAEERRHDAKSGAAMKDGSFPIENKEDLHNAMRLAGHAKDPAAARAHIKARAAALGLTSELSDAYKSESYSDRVKGFFANLFGTQPEDGIDHTVDKSVAALAESVASILKDKDADHGAELTKTFGQFGEHLKTEVSKALATGNVVLADNGNTDEGDDMSALLKKALGLKDDATDEDIVKALAKKDEQTASLALEVELLKADMDKDERAFHDKLATDELKKAFRGKTKAERAGDMTKRDDMPEYVRTILAENAEIKKSLAALQSGNSLESMKKKAVEVGLPETDAELLQKAYAGDKDAIDKLLEKQKAMINQIKAAGLFKELGSQLGGNGNSDDPVEQLKAKANELRKSQPGLTAEQAFAKVYSDPANAELAGKERMMNRPQAA